MWSVLEDVEGGGGRWGRRYRRLQICLLWKFTLRRGINEVGKGNRK